MMKGNAMDHIVDRIWLGSESAAQDLNLLRENNINAIISIEHDPHYANLYPQEWDYLHLSQFDGEPIPDKHFEKALDFIATNQKNDNNILIHCTVGASRSPSLVGAYLMDTYGYDPVEALDFMQKRRVQVFPASATYSSAIEYVYPDETWECDKCSKKWKYRTFFFDKHSNQDKQLCSCEYPVLTTNTKK